MKYFVPFENWREIVLKKESSLVIGEINELILF